MARKNKLTRILSICAVAVLCGLQLIPAVTPAYAYSNDGATALRSYLPMEIRWYGLNNEQTNTRIYERPLWNDFSLGDEAVNWYGPKIDGTGNIKVGGMFSSDTEDDEAYQYVADFSHGNFTVPIVQMRLAEPLFVPTDFDKRPFFRFSSYDNVVTGNCTVEGYYVIKRTNEAYTQVELAYEAFTYTYTFQLEAEQWYSVPIPVTTDKGIYLTKVDVNLSAVGGSDDVGHINSLQIETACFNKAEELASYNDQVCLMNALGFTAQLPSEVNADFVSWIGVAVGAFWNFELVPGLTIQGIVYGCLGLGLLIAFLKYFAGG